MKLAAYLAFLAPLASSLPAPQNPDHPSAEPLEEGPFLALGLRELIARWPVALTPEHIASHRFEVARWSALARGSLQK